MVQYELDILVGAEGVWVKMTAESSVYGREKIKYMQHNMPSYTQVIINLKCIFHETGPPYLLVCIH